MEKLAKIIRALLIAFLVFALLSFLVKLLIPVAIIALIVYLVMRFRFFRCPKCNAQIPPSGISKIRQGAEYYCPKCGGRIEVK